MQLFLAVILPGFGALGFATAQNVEAPKSPPPLLMIVSKVQQAQGTLHCYQAVAVPRTVTRNIQVVENGIPKVIPITVTEFATEYREIAVVAAKAEAHTAAGRKVAPDQVLKRIKPGQTILVSADGRKIDPAFLRAVQPDALVLIVEDLAGDRGVVVAPQRNVPPEVIPVPDKKLR